MSEASTGTWVVIGKLSTVVTLSLGILAVYSIVNPSGPELSATFDYSSFALPPDLVSTIEDVGRSQSWSALREQLTTFMNDTEIPSEDRLDLVEGLTTFFETQWPQQLRDYRNPYRGLWQFTVENTGDRIADDVVLALPLTGTALVDEAPNVRVVSNALKLGSLRPGDSISVILWSEEGTWSAALPSEFRLTHANGVGKVSFPSSFYGARAFIARHLGFIIAMGFWILLTTVGVVFSVVLSVRQASTKGLLRRICGSMTKGSEEF